MEEPLFFIPMIICYVLASKFLPVKMTSSATVEKNTEHNHADIACLILGLISFVGFIFFLILAVPKEI